MAISATHFNEVTNGYQRQTSGLWVHRGKIDAGHIRATKNYSGASFVGSGTELLYEPTNNTGFVLAFDRTNQQYQDLVISGKNVIVQTTGGALNLPDGSVQTADIADGAVTTAKIAANAATALLGQYHAVPTFSMTAVGVWTVTPVQVLATSLGGNLHVEATICVGHSAGGAVLAIGLGWNGTVQYNEGWQSMPFANSRATLHFHEWIPVGATTITWQVFLYNATAGTLSLDSASYSVLSITEHRR